MPAADEQVVIVGGGATGLSTAAALSRRGIDALVLDRDDRIGGTWARRYERLHLHTIRSCSGLAHYPIPRRYPRYLSKDDYVSYLAAYVEHFGLRVALNEPVVAVRPSGDGTWEVETTHRRLTTRAVVLATGHYAEPRVPRWDGAEAFEGRIIHSSAYRSGRDHAGSRVLVVGLGNSGAEIAADLVEQGAAEVSVAVRTPPPIVTRELFGVLPTQVVGIALTPLRIPRAVDRIGAVLRRRSVGDLTAYGLGEAAWGPFTARRPAVIDVGFLDVLRAGKVTVRPALASLTPTGARFADGSEHSFDVVIAATGFTTGLDRLLEHVPGVVDTEGRPLADSGRPSVASGLSTIGFDETVRGHLFEARRASKRLAKTLARSLRRD